MPQYIVSVDAGGTKILAALINSDNKIISQSKKPTDAKNGANAVINRIIECIESTLIDSKVKANQLAAIVVGIPGSLNSQKGIVYLAPNLSWRNINVVNPIKKHFNIPTFIENDANLGALGIHQFGLGKKYENLLGIFVGTGIGGGLILNNKIYRGKSFAAGEIGHIVIDPKGAKCGCGNFGCFEAIASRTAITREIKNAIKTGKKTVITKLTNDYDMIKSGILAAALQSNDKIVKKSLRSASETIGLVVGNMSNLLDLNAVVLAGGLIEAVGNFMLPVIRKSAEEVALPQNFKGMKILNSSFGDDAALYGGIALAKEVGLF
ncbi:MAG: ROK family protein [Bacteroidetes bacterium]|nr:ROK family protein [Bacteroidota bacterium]MBU2584031.1 ROK family protein [Bacteroidota bacterium]